MNKNRGLTIIETLLTLLAGLLVSAVLFEAFGGNAAFYKYQEEESDRFYNLRLSLDLIGRMIHNAGVRNFDDDPKIQPIASRTCGSSSCTTSENLALEYESTLTGLTLCTLFTSTRPTRADTQTSVIERVGVHNSQANRGNYLGCETFDPQTGGKVTSTVELMSYGVDHFQVRFHVVNSDGTHQYRSANDITDWSTIRAVEVALISREIRHASTMIANTSPVKNQVFNFFNNTEMQQFNDSNRRSFHHRTYLLNNRRDGQ